MIVSSDNDLCEAARSTHEVTQAKGDRVSVEAAVFNEYKRPILMAHYDSTRQLRYPDFDAARDSFDYKTGVPQTMEDMFVKTCAPVRQHFPT